MAGDPNTLIFTLENSLDINSVIILAIHPHLKTLLGRSQENHFIKAQAAL